MTVSVARSVERGLRSEDTAALSVAAADGVVEALAAAAARVRGLGDGESSEYPGASWVSDPMDAGDVVVMLIDAKGLSRNHASEAVAALRDELARVDGDVKVVEAEHSTRFPYPTDAQVQTGVVCHVIEEYDEYLRRALPGVDGLGAEIIKQFQPLIAEFLPDERPELVVGLAVPTTWDAIFDYAEHADVPTIFQTGANGVTCYAQSTWSGQLSLGFFGEPLQDPDMLTSLCTQLRDTIRQLPWTPAQSVIRPVSSAWMARLQPGPTHSNPNAETFSPRPWGYDEYLCGVGWSHTISGRLWRSLTEPQPGIVTVEPQHAERVDLADRRVEVTFGSPQDWADWASGDANVQNAANEFFAPALISQNEWYPLARISFRAAYACMKRFSSIIDPND